MSAAAPRAARDSSLDAARALAVVAMVMGHTLDALLATSLRETPGVLLYWKFRGLTAPMFLMVSGWAVVTVLSRATPGLAVVTGKLPRVALLLALGYLLRLPTWDLAGLRHGDPAVWRHFLAFDALHCVATGLLLGACVLALVESRGARIGAFAVLAVGVPLAAAPAWSALAGRALLLQQTIGGGDAPFPVAPWVGYFFAGALLGVVEPARLRPLPRAAILAATGLALAGGSWMFLRLAPQPLTSPLLFAWRAGQVLVLFGLVSLLPAAVGRLAAPLGRASLGIYLVHLPILYGWGDWQGLTRAWGQTLPLANAIGTGVALLVASALLVRGWREARKLVAWGLPALHVRVKALVPPRA